MIIATLVFAAELTLIALSFNLVYRMVGFANFAHTEVVTVGAITGVIAAGSMPLLLAGVLAVLVSGVLAVVINISVFQRFPRTNIGTLMIVSAGVAIALRGLIQAAFGVNARRYDEPTAAVTILGVHVSVMQLLIIAIAIACVLLFAALLRWTRIGRNVRAIGDDLTLAEVRGVRSSLVLNQVWFISGAMAGLAGVLLGIDTYVTPNMGLTLVIPMFAAAIVGGVGSPFGAILGAALVSLFQTAVVTIDFGHLFGSGSHFLGSEYKAVVAFMLLIAVLWIRPNGFFGEVKARA
jgi:branched-subunit amino acid ABC-type transport system permease component